MALSNRERTQKGIEQLTAGLMPYVERELKAQLGGYWIEQLKGRVRVQIDKSGAVHWDAQGLLKAMVDFWKEVFARKLGHMERALVGELIEVRNQWAHERPFSSDDTYRALDSMERLLKALSASTQAEEVAKHKADLQRTVYAEQARAQTRAPLTLEGSPKTGLKAWRQVVTPHPDVSSGRYVQAEFAADLAQVHRGEGSDEYRDPAEFFRRTFITAGLEDLLAGALLRMASQGGDPVVELQTNFGGGKTHSMLALFHIFGGAPVGSLVGVDAVMKKVGVSKVPKASRAVLVGTALSPGEVSTKPDGTKVHTIWGEMAWQLGGKAGYAIVAESDQRAAAPGSDTLKTLFKKVGPALVLIDEWVAYARQTVERDGLPGGRFEVQTSFAQSLTEAARAVPGTLVVASIPASKIEVGGDHGEQALEMLKNVFERVGKAWRPATGDEGFEIVRRRLFQPISAADAPARDAVVDAFSKMYRESPQEFPQGCAEGAYRRELEAAYPIHPALFRHLYEDWSSLDKFQRTRGVLRLLASVIHRLWERQDGGLLILPSSVPLDDGGVRSEVTRYLDDNWEPIIDQDIDGPHSTPFEIDQATPTLGRYSATRRVSRALYVGTAPGADKRDPGIDDRAVRLACAQPGETVATFGDALRRVSDRARHIHQDGNRYWVSPKTNLNRLAEDRASALMREPEKLQAEIVDRLRLEKDRGDFVRVHICPESSIDVDDEPVARLVVLPPRATHRKDMPDSEGKRLARKILDERGNGPRIYRNTLIFVAPDTSQLDDLSQAVAQFLAWEKIVEDHDNEALNLDNAQKKHAQKKRDEANETIRLRIAATWIHHLIPMQKEPAAEIAWEEARVTTGGDTLAKRASDKLRPTEGIMPVLGGPRLRMAMDKYNLWTGDDHVAFPKLADFFARYVYLPRVVNRDVIAKAVANGVAELITKDTFAIATGFDDAKKRYTGLKKGGVAGAVIDNATLVVHPDAAERQQPSLPPPPAPHDTTPPPPGGGPKPPTPQRHPTAFIASARLDANRIGRDAGKIAEEVVQHLSTLAGAEVEVTLEIQVRVPGGVKDDVVRTVTENCNTLKFKIHGFE
jgi:predicted AAA+ superfamily ATPase